MNIPELITGRPSLRRETRKRFHVIRNGVVIRMMVWMGSLFLGSQLTVHADLSLPSILAVYGEDFEESHHVPGRPWVEVQYRYQTEDVIISCNFVAGRCLWIDYWSKKGKLDEAYMFSEMKKLFPDQAWSPIDRHGKRLSWLNEDEDRLTRRSKGFTLHMNEYIRNVLSRRAQWSF